MRERPGIPPALPPCCRAVPRSAAALGLSHYPLICVILLHVCLSECPSVCPSVRLFVRPSACDEPPQVRRTTLSLRPPFRRCPFLSPDRNGENNKNKAVVTVSSTRGGNVERAARGEWSAACDARTQQSPWRRRLARLYCVPAAPRRPTRRGDGATPCDTAPRPKIRAGVVVVAEMAGTGIVAENGDRVRSEGGAQRRDCR